MVKYSELHRHCDISHFKQGRGRQPIDIRLSVMAVTRRGLPIESITGAEALVESCGDGEPQKKKRATEQSISSSRGETLGSPVVPERLSWQKHGRVACRVSHTAKGAQVRVLAVRSRWFSLGIPEGGWHWRWYFCMQGLFYHTTAEPTDQVPK
ncbi:UNVERIFIED_CONTAM: hypothetical protein FKN15_007757 [Acipenser sinensis]